MLLFDILDVVTK